MRISSLTKMFYVVLAGAALFFTMSARSQTKAGDTVEPIAIPVQNYAVIDVSGTSADADVLNVALDDSGNVAFGYKKSGSSGGYQIKLWANGQVTTGQSVPESENSQDGDRKTVKNYSETSMRLLPDGRVYGYMWIDYYLTVDGVDVYEPGVGTGFLSVNNQITELDFTPPYSVFDGDWDLSWSIADATMNSYCGWGDFIPGPQLPPGEISQAGGLIVVGSAGKVFDAGGSASNGVVAQEFRPSMVNESGQAAGWGYDSNFQTFNQYFWDGSNRIDLSSAYSSTITVHATDLNKQGMVVGGASNATTTFNGFFRDSSPPGIQKFTDLMPGVLKGQIKEVWPFLLSDVQTSDNTFSIISTAQTAKAHSSEFEKSYLLWKRDAEKKWTVAKIQLPDGVVVDDTSFRVINQSGVIAAVGKPNASATKHAMLLIPLDLDIVYPATGELSESREESEGGLIPIRVDDKSPVTKLRIHKCGGMPAAQFKITFTGNNIKIWKNVDRTGPVTSDSTTFVTNVDTDLYLEGVTKSDSVKDIEIGLKLILGTTESLPLIAKTTVVQAEFPVTIRAFIPYRWVDAPASTQPGFPYGTFDVVAIGDSRTFDSSLNGTYRAEQKLILIPYEDLSHDGIKKISNANDQVDGGTSIHYRKSTSVPQSEQGKSHGESLVTNPEEIARGNGSTGTHYVTLMQRINNRKSIFKVECVSYEGVLGSAFSEPIQWVFNFGFDGTNALKVSCLFDGRRRGFPAYEVYVMNSEEGHQPIYTWAPHPNRGIGSLFSTEEVAPNGPLKVKLK